VRLCYVIDSLTSTEESYFVTFEVSSGKKLKSNKLYGIMGKIMDGRIPKLFLQPQADESYNERVDLRTSHPIYCFPIIDRQNSGRAVGAI